MASEVSVLHAPTPTPVVIAVTGLLPDRTPAITPAIVQSPDPVVPTTFVLKHGASSCLFAHVEKSTPCPAALAKRATLALVLR